MLETTSFHFLYIYSIKPVEKAAVEQAIEVLLISDELFR